jgi:hypothetical protein
LREAARWCWRLNLDWVIALSVDAFGQSYGHNGVLGGVGFAGFEAREAEVMLVTGTVALADRGPSPQSAVLADLDPQDSDSLQAAHSRLIPRHALRLHSRACEKSAFSINSIWPCRRLVPGHPYVNCL